MCIRDRIKGCQLRYHLGIDLLYELRPVSPVGVRRHIFQLPVQILQNLAVGLIGPGPAEGPLQVLHSGLDH